MPTESDTCRTLITPKLQAAGWEHKPHFDNSSDTPRLIFKDEAGRTTINDAALYDRLRKEFAP